MTVTVIPDSNNTLIRKCCFSIFPLIFCMLRVHKKGLIWQEKMLWYGTNGEKVLGVLVLSCDVKPTHESESRIFLTNVICFYESKRAFPLTTSEKDHQSLIDPLYSLLICVWVYIWTDTYMRSQNMLYVSIFTWELLRPLETTSI